MKVLPLAAVLLLAACNEKQHDAPAPAPAPAPAVAPGSAAAPGSAPPGPGSATTAIPAADDVCRIGMDAIDHASCGSAAGSIKAARSSLETISSTVQTTGTNDPHGYEVTCSRLVDAIDRDAAKAGCTLAIDPALRARIAKTVEAYYAQRTPVTPTGDAAADAVIAKVAAMRDAACACKDQACLDKVDEQLVTIPAMPTTVSQAARDLGSKLLDDAARCAQRVKMQP